MVANIIIKFIIIFSAKALADWHMAQIQFHCVMLHYDDDDDAKKMIKFMPYDVHEDSLITDKITAHIFAHYKRKEKQANDNEGGKAATLYHEVKRVMWSKKNWYRALLIARMTLGILFTMLGFAVYASVTRDNTNVAGSFTFNAVVWSALVFIPVQFVIVWCDPDFKYKEAKLTIVPLM